MSEQARYDGSDAEIPKHLRESLYEAWTVYRDEQDVLGEGASIADFRAGFVYGAAEVERLRGTLARLSRWDHLDTAADGTYWKDEINKSLREEETKGE